MISLDKLSETRRRMSEKILGFDIGHANAKHFIVTNIKPLFEAVAKAGNTEREFFGFYHSIEIVLNSNNYMMTLLTPGNIIIDVLKLLDGKAASVTLLGLCGSLNPLYPVSSIVTPQYVADSAAPSQREMLNADCNNGLCTCQVEGLVQTEDFYRRLVDAGIDFVDMESYFMRKYLPEARLQTVSVVSDMPLSSPFYLDHSTTIDIDTIRSFL